MNIINGQKSSTVRAYVPLMKKKSSETAMRKSAKNLQKQLITRSHAYISFWPVSGGPVDDQLHPLFHICSLR